MFLSVCLCFRLVFLSFCIYNRKKKTRTNRKLEGNKKHKKQHKSPSRNLRDIYSRSGRGLDIMYFCCFSVCLRVVLFCFCFFLFVLCFRLVFLSFCIYNRQTHNVKPCKFVNVFNIMCSLESRENNDAQSFSPTINMCFRVFFA